MRQFLTIFSGQFASVLGSGLTIFALGVYVFQKTGSTTDYAMILFFAFLPPIIFAPIAGPIVDRFNRRLVMIVTDSFAALGTLLLLFLIRNGEIEVWHVYLVSAISATATPFQLPAYNASISQLVPGDKLMRANGLVRTSEGFQRMLSPILAAWLLGTVSLKGIIWIDLFTFLIAVTTLLMVRIPDLPPQLGKKTSIRADIKEGFAYLWQRKPLLGLMAMFFCYNFFMGMLMALFTPMLLSFTDTQTLGAIMSVFGASVILGGIGVTVFGGPKRLMTGIFVGMVCSGLAMIIIGLTKNVYLMGSSCLIFGMAMPMIVSSSQTIWQKKIPHRLQGRIHSTRMMVAFASTPLAYLSCGPLVDHIFEPLMVSGSDLALRLVPLFGGDIGQGSAVLMSLLGLLNLIFLLCVTMMPTLRNLEDLVPDATDA